MSKARLNEVIVRSFPIYELQQIRLDSLRYPRRKIKVQRIGFFHSRESAEEAILSFINDQKRFCRYKGENYHDNFFGFFINEELVHNKYSTYYNDERPCKCYSFTADGELNDYVALDEFGRYSGRNKKDIRFDVGDIVEVVDDHHAELAIVGAQPLTTDTYRRMEEDPDECEHPSRFLNEGNDCYMVYIMGKDNSHYHPLCYKLFRPTRHVNAIMAARLKAKLKELSS